MLLLWLLLAIRRTDGDTSYKLIDVKRMEGLCCCRFMKHVIEHVCLTGIVSLWVLFDGSVRSLMHEIS
jgi:hypothetical protein